MAVIADALKLTPAAVLTSTAASQVVQTTAGSNLILSAPGSNRLSGKQFSLRASGNAFSGAGTFTATVQPILYGDSSLATVTTKPLFSATAGTLAYTGTASASIPWAMSGTFMGDATSLTMTGDVDCLVGTTYKIKTVITAPVSAGSISWATEPPVKFAIGCTAAGTVGASFKFVVEEFVLTQE